MIKTTGAIIAALAIGVLLAGCSAESHPGSIAATSTAHADSKMQSAQVKASDPTPTPSTAELTAAGAICDPHSANDPLCAAFHPDTSVINMTLAPRSGEPLASLSDDKRIALAHQACDQLRSGATYYTVNVIDTAPADAAKGLNNNYTLASAGALAYCEDSISTDDFGKQLKWTLDTYRSMGEDAALASFTKGHVVIQPPSN